MIPLGGVVLALQAGALLLLRESPSEHTDLE
jgi:hypothetical protein